MVGWLNEQESRGFSDVAGKLRSTSLELPCGEQKFMGVEVTSSQSHIETTVRNGKPVANIRFKVFGNIVDRACLNVDVTDPAEIEKLQKQAEGEVRIHMEAAVKRAQEMKTDIFGFGNNLRQTNPAQWKRLKNNWDDVYFPALEVRFEIKAYIRKTGTIGNTPLKS